MSEDYLPLGKAVQRAIGIRPHITTLLRWCAQGVARPDGQRVKLKSKKIGGRRMATAAWVQEFVDATNEEPSEPPRRRSPSRRERDIELASKRLDEALR